MLNINRNIIKSCEDEPSGIFPLINRGEFDTVEYLIDKGIVNINTVDMNNNDVLVRLLKVKQYNLVLKYIKKRNWDVNHQNVDGDTFGHILACDNSASSIKVVDALLSKKRFLPNIRNNKGETLLDKAIHNNYLISSLKILEDKRFTSIDLYDFKGLFDLSINNDYYGKYSKISNFNSIIKSLNKKELQPNMKKLVDRMYDNRVAIRANIMDDSLDVVTSIINTTINEVII